jgi:hypothetical protein
MTKFQLDRVRDLARGDAIPLSGSVSQAIRNAGIQLTQFTTYHGEKRFHLANSRSEDVAARILRGVDVLNGVDNEPNNLQSNGRDDG